MAGQTDLVRTPATAAQPPRAKPALAATAIPGPLLIIPQRIGDGRGWFAETFRADSLAELDISFPLVQENQSFSARQGTVRGLHWQAAPAAQAKLISVPAGAILDVAVDLRRSSPTFGQHIAVRLDAHEGRQLYVPVGFAHGFCTLEPNTLVAYKVSGAPYSPEHERRLAFDDPALRIFWPVTRATAALSPRDATAPSLAEVELFA